MPPLKVWGRKIKADVRSASSNVIVTSFYQLNIRILHSKERLFELLAANYLLYIPYRRYSPKSSTPSSHLTLILLHIRNQGNSQEGFFEPFPQTFCLLLTFYAYTDPWVRASLSIIKCNSNTFVWTFSVTVYVKK